MKARSKEIVSISWPWPSEVLRLCAILYSCYAFDASLMHWACHINVLCKLTLMINK